MESNLKMVIIVAVTIIAGLLVFNIGKISGQAYLTEGIAQPEAAAPEMNTRVSVTPTTVKYGQEITVTVYPGDSGALEEVKIYKADGFYEKTFYLDCGGFKCVESPSTGKTTIPFVDAGQYYVKVMDIATEQYAYGYFNIIK